MEQNYENKINLFFINALLKNGHKPSSEKLFKKILIHLKIKTKQKPNFILVKAIKNLSPKLKIFKIPMTRGKKRNKNKQKFKPFLLFLNTEKQIKSSINLILLFSKSKNFLKTLIIEIINTYNKKSKSLEKKKIEYKELKKLHYFLKIIK